MPDYVKLAETAKRLIEGAGRDLTVRKLATEAAVTESNTPWRGNDESETDPDQGAPVEVEVRGVILGYTDVSDTSDTLKRGTKRALVAQNSAVDQSGDAVNLKDFDQLIDGDEVWKIVQVDPLTPGDVCLLYQFHLRQ